MMESLTRATLNMNYPNVATVIYAVQGDRLSRYILADLVNGSLGWQPPDGAYASVRFKKPDGTAGAYDVDEAGNPAVSIEGHTAKIAIAHQALAIPGAVQMELNFYSAEAERLSSFSWILAVKPSALTDTELMSTDYYDILSQQIAAVLAASESLSGITASVIGLPAGSEPSVEVRGGDGTPYELAFSLPSGPQGKEGAPGAYFTPAVSADGTISWTNNGGLANPPSVDITGPKGAPGAYFTPAVSADGTISWTNNGGLDNPADVNVQGPQGDPPTVKSAAAAYQTSDDGEHAPAGPWLATPPQVASGRYLWSRITIEFSRGDPVVYCVPVRFGVDGSGAVLSVNGLSGNVKLTASDIGAVPDTEGAVGTANLADGSVTTEKLAAHAVSTDYTATIGTGWAGDTAPYSVEVTVNGILASDTPLIDLAPAEDFVEAEMQIEAWGYVYRAVTGDGKITFYATGKPEVDIPIKIKAVRK